MLRRRRTTNRIGRFGIESLENRCLLAGDIIIVVGATTNVTGDDLANELEISKGLAPNEIIFRGLNGTTVNGNAAPFVQTIPGGLQKLGVNLAGGDNLLVITNLSEATATWPVAANPQTGTDLTIAGDISIKGGNEKDIVLLRHLNITGKLVVKTGSGDDIVVAESLTLGKTIGIGTGSGNDQVLGRVLNVTGKGKIGTSAGNDAVGIYNSTLHGTSISGGADNDQIWFESNTTANAKDVIKLVGSGGTNDVTEDVDVHNNLASDVFAAKLNATLELSSHVHFEYEGEEGPNHWGELTPAFLLSEAGRQQSPVNIDTSKLTDVNLPTIATSYVADAGDIFVHNGHTIQVTVPPGNTITVAGNTYNLLQFHFHSLSEHTVDGIGFPLEFHLVHQDAAGNLLVLGVFIQAGAANAAFNTLIADLPNKVNLPSTTIAGSLNPEDLLPVDRTYYAYNGSLTTPPASEGVSFAIFKTPIELSQAQIDAIIASLAEPNARPVQPVNDRVIFS